MKSIVDQIIKRKLMMRKGSQHLPMMPNFGGECKTTGLVRKIVQVAYENQLKLLEFDRVLLAVRVEKISQEL